MSVVGALFGVAALIVALGQMAQLRYLHAKAETTSKRLAALEAARQEQWTQHQRAVELNVAWAMNRTPADWKVPA